MFWWSFRYADDQSEPTPLPGFTTANEIHIPVGRPVHLRVTSADVIHSFWVPQLVGRMDMIPGQINETWLQADRPGVYRGQCGEFCGLQHAGMGFDVIAETPEDYLAWRRHQLEAPGSVPALQAAMTLFDENCGSCHAVRGTSDQAQIAPDLSHLASRQRIASGVLPNTERSLRLWLTDPDAVKPGTPMPRPALSDDKITAIISYLDSLK
jgi:cytochrome c oxidase subunit 2